MFNPQNYEKMKTEIAKKIKEFVEEIQDTDKQYRLMYKDKEFSAWSDEDFMYIYITKDKMFKEKVNLYPIFSFSEIKEALTKF